MESDTEKITKLISNVKNGSISIDDAEPRIKELIVKGRYINPSEIVDRLFYYWYQSPVLGPKIYDYIDFLIEKGKNIRERNSDTIIERLIGTSLRNDPLASLNLEYFLSLLQRGIVKADEKLILDRRRPPISIYEYALEKYKKDSFELLKGLYEHGFNINEQNEKGQTPLMLAIDKLNLDDVMFLIHEGADLNSKDNLGRTPLIYMLRRKFGMLEHWPETHTILLSTIENPSVDILAQDTAGNNILDYLLKDDLLDNIYRDIKPKLTGWRTSILEFMFQKFPQEIMDQLIKPEHMNLSPVFSKYALKNTPLPNNYIRRIGEFKAGPYKGGRCRQKKTRKNRQQKRKTIRHRRH